MWLVLSAIVATGCAGDGCTCAGPIPGGFPSEERVENAVQVRISDTGLAALGQDPDALLDNLLGEGGLIIEVPPACAESDNPKICCDENGTPITPCGPVEIDIERQPGDDPRLELDPADGAGRLDVTVRGRARTLAAMPIIYDTGLFDVDCDATIDTEAGGEDDLRVSIPISFVQDPSAGTTRVEVGEVDIDQFNNSDLSLSGGFDCNIADLLVFAFKGSLISTVETLVADTITEQTCKPCASGDVAECGQFADTCDSGVCMAGDQCLQELGIAARLPAAALLGSISPGTPGAVDLYDVLGGYATSDDDGLSFGLLGGALPGDTSRRCGPSAPAPDDSTVAITSFFQGNVRPDTGDGFDIAFGVHKHHLYQFIWSAYESGFLCLNLGTSTVDLLTTDTMSLIMPSVIDLVHGRTAQMVLGLRPQEPPGVAIGRGTFIDDGNGGQTIDEPLLDVTMDDLAIDFYAMIDDQFIRMMTVRADVRLPINLDATAEGELSPVLGDLDNAFQNLRIENSDALLETPDELATRFPAVLDLALPMIAGSLGPIAIPDVAGLRIRVLPGGATAVEDNQFLAVFAGVEYAPPSARQARAETAAEIAAVHVPHGSAFLDQRDAVRPRIEIALGGRVSDGGGEHLEWSIRVDGGTWSTYSRSERVTLSRAAFWIQGRHTVEVRARLVGVPNSTDPTPVVLRPIIDVTPPHAVVASPLGDIARGDELSRPWLLATDNVSRGRLRARYRAPEATAEATTDTSWQSLPVPSALPLDSGDLELEVRDEAGNVRRLQVPARTSAARLPASAPARIRATGCTASDAPVGAHPWLLFLLGLAALSLFRPVRRKRGALTGALAAIVALAGLAGGCGGKNQCDVSGGEVSPGPTGRYSSLAIRGDRVVISAYDDVLGDLVLIDVSPGAEGVDAVARRQVVDGIPEGIEPSYITCSYRGGVISDGADVGAWTSVALAAEGSRERARIAYQDVDNGDLLFTFEDGDGWHKHIVDSGDGGVAGLHTSLALDSDDVPAIAYMVVGIPGPDGARLDQLRYARANVAAPDSADDWTITVLEERTVSCAGLCASGEECALVGGAEQCVTPTGDCSADCGADVCLQGVCVAAIGAPPAYELPGGAGLFAKLAFLTGDRPAIAFYDRSTADLILKVGGPTWTTYPLDADPVTDTGMWVSMVVDDRDVVHVTYQDALNDRLLYTSWDSGATGPVEVVDSGVREGDRPHPVGASSALVIDGSGQISVAYQDGQTSDLLVAIREDSSWTRYDLVTGPNLYGFFVQAKPFEQSVLISNYAYDRTSNTLGQLMISRTQ